MDRRYEKYNSGSDKMISVGIDVSKGKSMVCIMKPYGEVIASPYEITHTEPEVTKLSQRLLALEGEVRVVVEATGAYHLPVLCSLQQAGIFVAVINPLVMKKYASAAIRKGKTDKLDSVKIANYGLDNWFHLEDYRAPAEIYADLKLLGRQYQHYIALSVMSLNSLTHLLDGVMPGIKTLLRPSKEGRKGSKLGDFVEEFWHFDSIKKMSEQRFVNTYCRWAKKKGYHSSERKAQAIYAIAQNGIPSLPATPLTKTLVLEAVRVLRELDKTLESILSQMQQLASSLPEYPVVMAMKGVGAALGPRLISEIGDVRRFHSGSALVAFAGIDAPPYESGSFVGTQRSISKRGSPVLRKTGYEIMKALKTTKPTEDAAVYEFMLKKEAEGKHKKAAKIAGLNKFLRIYYARVMEVYSE
jgi:transposase